LAWTDTCKIEACAQIDNRKKILGEVKRALRELSKESGIPISTLKRWYYKIENKPRIINDPYKPASGETCAISDLQKLIANGQKFGTIYADPPWKYSNQATRASTNNHYETMLPEEIAQLPIKELTADKAHLHLWTTNAFLFECSEILKKWEFEYKGVFVWIKPQMGIGNYWRVSHEFLILGVKGNQTFYKKNHLSWIKSDRVGHSRKPEELSQIIERVSPGPYLELFGRRTRNNWTVWGDEIERDLFNKSAFR
jgi:N6-adenosine-specific RNA methylase IME4